MADDSYLGWKIDFASPAGEPALLHPSSVAWRVYKNPIALGVGGVAAALGDLAERFSAETSPPRQACVRLGLPSNFLYRSRRAQQRMLRAAGLDDPAATGEPTPSIPVDSSASARSAPEVAT